ncbi:hypothetical protein LCGC14_1434970 [marine sediment metagenome]|uniref:Phage tail protein n=1 Tax=marine sediment metagenome TaxID=412755 RepID=A0A0F9JME3_9ZZZZ
MAVVNVRLNNSDLKLGIASLRRKFPRAIKRAVKRAGTAGRAVMTKEIAADTGLPSKRIKQEIRINQLGDTGVQLEVRGRRIPLIDFKAKGPEPSRGRGRGVSYRLPGGRGRAPHAFIATMPSGHRGVFRRRGSARSPIIQLHGPSLVRVFEKFLPLGAKRAEEALVKNLRSEISFALRGRR